jgi:thiosulfate/3-mercaptopyruvate sulfurtransferase
MNKKNIDPTPDDPRERNESMSATLVLAVLATLAGGEKQARYPRPELLREPAELSKRLRETRVLDARPRAKYEAGHVPGAVWVNTREWAKAFNTEPEQTAWASRIGKLGIKADTPVVVYDDVRSNNSARIWWILRYWGVRDVRLLNGGWPGWPRAARQAPRQRRSKRSNPVWRCRRSVWRRKPMCWPP